MMTKNNIQVSDSTISQIISNDDGSLDVYLNNWDDTKKIIHFRDVVAFLSFGSIGCELSHIEVKNDDDFKVEAQKYTDEDLMKMKCYIFIDVWSNKSILKIIGTQD